MLNATDQKGFRHASMSHYLLLVNVNSSFHFLAPKEITAEYVESIFELLNYSTHFSTLDYTLDRLNEQLINYRRLD